MAILTGYPDFAHVFSKKLVELPLENTDINNHTIKLVNSKQPLYEPIYSLKLVELESLNTYIETNLANNFIQPYKFSVGALIFFIKKLTVTFAYL